MVKPVAILGSAKRQRIADRRHRIAHGDGGAEFSQNRGRVVVGAITGGWFLVAIFGGFSGCLMDVYGGLMMINDGWWFLVAMNFIFPEILGVCHHPN